MNRSERRRLRTHLDLLRSLRAELSAADAEAVTVQSVTDRADVALGTFYNHFDDKTGALEALCVMECNALRQQVRELTGRDHAMPRYATALSVVLIQRAAADPTWVRSMVALVDGHYWPTSEMTLWHHAMLTDANPTLNHDQLSWHTNSFHGSITALYRVLADEGFSGPMAERVATVTRSIVASIGFTGEVIDAEVEWALGVPVATEWRSSESYVEQGDDAPSASVNGSG